MYSDNMNAETLQHLYRSRAGHASDVTRRQNALDSALQSEASLSEVEERYVALQDAVAKFKSAHDMYIREASTSDSQKVKVANDHYEEMEHSWNAAYKRYQQYMESVVGHLGSVSQTGSRGSCRSTASARARAASKRAALEVKLSHSKIKNELEFKRLELQLQLNKAELEAEISAAKAEEETLARFEDPERVEITWGSAPKYHSTPCLINQENLKLNPDASPWRSENCTDQSFIQQQMVDSIKASSNNRW